MTTLCVWALRHALRRRLALLGVFTTMLLKVGLELLKPLPMLVLVDHVLMARPMSSALAAFIDWLPGSATPQSLLTWCVIATVILFLLTWTAGLANNLANMHFGQRLVYDLAAELFGHLQRLSLQFHSRKSVGDSLRRVTSDCGCVASIVRDALLPILTSALTLAAMCAIMWTLDPVLTIVAVAVVPYMIFVFRRYDQPMRERSYEQQQVDGRLYALLEQTLSAMPVVQAFGREETNCERFEASSRDAVDAALATTNAQLQFKVLIGLATALGTAAILWIGATHVLDGRLTVGSILVFLSYLAALYAPLEALMYTSSTIHTAAGSARRVLEVLQLEPEILDRPGAVPLATAVGHIRIENATFGYEAARPVLHDVSLEIRPGETVAIVGPTGAGKTTLVSLVPRFFDPWAGRVLLDGHDVRDLQVRTLRRHVAFVLQESFLFPRTIAENIAYGRPEATPAEIEAAARAANAHAFIERLPHGYDTVVGERGASLSGGERQRLSIARAFLLNAPILILDEPTSALDAETENQLLDALRRLTQGRTTLIIAHRFSTIRDADRIVVLECGRIVEAGTHVALLALGQRYAHLHGLQFGGPAQMAT